MMPIFFDVQAHCWIVYALFVNGVLATYLIEHNFKSAKPLFAIIESRVIAGFGLSLIFNGAVLLFLDLANTPFAAALYPMLIATFLLVVLLNRAGLSLKMLVPNFALTNLLLYLFMFVVLFYNGGLIDQVSDAWWHMSLANKIGWESSFTLAKGHLTGYPERYYPPLWHGNLALLRELSGQTLPVLWNAYTAWGGVLKLMAYFLLGLALFKDRKIAIIGALLFALLPGMGNSYMRVSAWPSHVSYVFMFYAFFLALHLLDRLAGLKMVKEQFMNVVSRPLTLLFLLLCFVLMFYLHQLEVLLFLVGMFLFCISCSIGSRLQEPETSRLSCYPAILSLVYRCLLLGLMALTIAVGFDSLRTFNDLDKVMVCVIPFCALASLCVIEFFRVERVTTWWIVGSQLMVILITINYQHLASLFLPELALQRSGGHERPLLARGVFGGELILPAWHLQLRVGLLWSGVLGLAIALFFSFRSSDRGILFISANSFFVWLLCLNPYFYQWLTMILGNYHSAWRFAILSFHPIIIAYAAVCLFRYTIVSREASDD